jgi:hypothetical protein
MILSNNGIIQSGKSLGGGGGVDPFAANVALFLKGNDTNNTNIVDNSSFNHSIVNQKRQVHR